MRRLLGAGLLVLGIGVSVTGLDGNGAGTTTALDGRTLFTAKGCSGCHLGPGVEAGADVGPDLSGGGADADDLRRSIADPDAEIVAGYPPVMPDLGLSAAEIDALVAFLVAGG